MKTLIIGTDSIIGKALAKALKDKGHDVVSTSRTATNKPHSIHFDLSQSPENWPVWPDNIDVAFIAAAITKQQVCEDDPRQANFINVEQTLSLIHQLNKRGIYTIYPSTNLVLPCNKPFQPVDAPHAPRGVYATTKACIEERAGHLDNFAITRLPKIFDGKNDILAQWKTALEQGHKIRAYSNVSVSPVSMAHAIRFIMALFERRFKGIWHVSGEKDTTYADLAWDYATALGITPEVQNKLIEIVSSGSEAPEYASLDMSKSLSAMGIGAQSLDDVFYDCLSSPSNSSS